MAAIGALGEWKSQHEKDKGLCLNKCYHQRMCLCVGGGGVLVEGQVACIMSVCVSVIQSDTCVNGPDVSSSRIISYECMNNLFTYYTMLWMS